MNDIEKYKIEKYKEDNLNFNNKLKTIENFFNRFSVDEEFQEENYILAIGYASWASSVATNIYMQKYDPTKKNISEEYHLEYIISNNKKIETLSEYIDFDDFKDDLGVTKIINIYYFSLGLIQSNFNNFFDTIEIDETYKNISNK